MTYVPIKELHVKQKQDKFLKEQLEKEREQQLLEDIERTEKERVKKKGKYHSLTDFSFAGLKVLKQSGVLDGYQYLLTNLCQYGLPTGDLYEFSALTILRYEKKLKATKKRELEARLKQRTDANSLVRARGGEASPPREEE